MSTSTETPTFKPPQTVGGGDSDSEDGVPTPAFFAAIVGILLIIVVIAIFVGKYRAGNQAQRWRGPNSPSLIYSVTLHGVGGSAFVNSVEDFLRESARQNGEFPNRDDEEEQREIIDKQITGLPSYEESIRSYPVCPSEPGKEEVPPPPPYFE